MEEPPRIDRILSSRGISLSDTATILQSFLSTLDNNHGVKDDTVTTAKSPTKSTDTPRKSRNEIEEEAILKQFDLLSKQPSGLVSDDTYERLKLIRDSIVGQAEGRPLLPSMIKSVKEEEFDADTVKEETNIKEEEDPTQQFIDELDAVQHDLQQEQEAKKLAKRAKKEKKAAKKAKKEAKKKRRMGRESDGGEKRIKVEMSD